MCSFFFLFNSGVIFDGSELLYIEPRNSSSLDDEHLILKHSDLLLNLTCGKLLFYSSNKCIFNIKYVVYRNSFCLATF